MRAENPANGDIVNRVGHDCAAIPLAVSGQRKSGAAQSIEVVCREIEFLLEAQRPPLVAGARANVETLVKMLSELEGADPVRRAVQMRPAALDAEIKNPRPA